MPSAVISDIIYHAKTKTLTAGTYGRGIWRMQVPPEFRIVPAEEKLDADTLLPLVEGYFLDRQAPIPEPVTPVEGASFSTSQDLPPFACTPVAGAIRYVFEAERNQSKNFKIYSVQSPRRPTAPGRYPRPANQCRIPGL